MALNDTDEILAVKAAELYYEAGKTQDEIGVALNVSRWKVGRLLVAAREHGFVRIEIVHPSAQRFSLERELGSRTRSSFPLRRPTRTCRRGSHRPRPTT